MFDCLAMIVTPLYARKVRVPFNSMTTLYARIRNAVKCTKVWETKDSTAQPSQPSQPSQPRPCKSYTLSHSRDTACKCYMGEWAGVGHLALFHADRVISTRWV